MQLRVLFIAVAVLVVATHVSAIEDRRHHSSARRSLLRGPGTKKCTQEELMAEAANVFQDRPDVTRGAWKRALSADGTVDVPDADTVRQGMKNKCATEGFSDQLDCILKARTPEYDQLTLAAFNDVKGKYATAKAGVDPDALLKRNFFTVLSISATWKKSLDGPTRNWPDLAPKVKSVWKMWQELVSDRERNALVVVNKDKQRTVRVKAFHQLVKSVNAMVESQSSSAYRDPKKPEVPVLKNTRERPTQMERTGVDRGWDIPHTLFTVCERVGNMKPKCVFELPELIEASMGKIAEFVITEIDAPTMTPLEFGARVHQAIVSVHPFSGGNGRTSMFIGLWLLARGDVFPIPSLDSHLVEFGRCKDLVAGPHFLTSPTMASKLPTVVEAINAYAVGARATLSAMTSPAAITEKATGIKELFDLMK